MSVIESEDYDEFVTSTIVHDVDKYTRSRLCGAARLNFDDVFRNARLKFKFSCSLAIKVSWSVSHHRAQPVFFRTNHPFLSFLGAVNI